MPKFFDIFSVVIIGASEGSGKIGNDILKNLKAFKGEKFGVNPKGGVFEGIEFFSSIEDLPIVPDVAVIVIPARFVRDSLKACGEKTIKRVIIISAGFKEIGDGDSERELQRLAKKYEIELLGPNCLGYVDAHRNLNLSFGAKNILPGNIALISQSGAMAVALIDIALESDLGFSKIISMGNKAGVDENTLLHELENDPETQVIALYLESIEDGKRFYDITKRLSFSKPIILIKSGISTKGSLAASSHTGALASKREILETAFEGANIHTTHSIEDFVLLAEAFSETIGKHIPEEFVIITNAGGPGVMTTDHFEESGIALATFSPEEKTTLMEGLPEAASINNPLDIIGDATSVRYKTILENIMKLKRSLSIYVILTPQTITDVDTISEVLGEFSSKHPDVFVAASFIGGASVQKAKNILKKSPILHYDFPRDAAKTFGKLLKQQSLKPEKRNQEIKFQVPDHIIHNFRRALQAEKKLCSISLTSDILEAFEIEHHKDFLAEKKDDILSIWKKINNPKVVAKIASPDIPHKTDVGGVVLDITSLKQAQEVYDSMMKSVVSKKPKAEILGITFGAMGEKTPSTREVFVGCKRDTSFGDILIVGIGGIYVNVYEDVQRAILPVSPENIEKMFQKLTGYPLLSGVRGAKPVNFDVLSHITYKIASVFQNIPEIREIDINPLFSDDVKSIVVDAKLYI